MTPQRQMLQPTLRTVLFSLSSTTGTITIQAPSTRRQLSFRLFSQSHPLLSIPHNNPQCRVNVHTLSSTSSSRIFRAKMWTSVEDTRLCDAVRQNGQDWVRVAATVGNGRDNRACRQRWLRLNSCQKVGPFSAAETSRVRQLLKQYPNQWTCVARKLGTGRTGEQVRDLVLERLNPELSLTAWTEDEDNLLREGVQKFGVGQWAQIAKLVPGRNDASCSSRWNFSLASGLVKGMWTEEEDKRLLHAVGQLRKLEEPFHFGQVAHLMGDTRHRKACLSRYERLVQQGRAEKLRKHRRGQGPALGFLS